MSRVGNGWASKETDDNGYKAENGEETEGQMRYNFVIGMAFIRKIREMDDETR
jgi:hypothetical protein